MSECTGKDCEHPSHDDDIKVVKLGDMENGVPATQDQFEKAAAQLGVEPETLEEAAEVVAEPQAIRNPIITPGDPERWPLLEMPSQFCNLPLTPEDEEAVVLMDQLLDILDDEAAGLAAVQIGYPRRIFLLRNATTEEGEPANNAYFNPIVVSKSKAKKNAPEACLSLPHMATRCWRPKSVTLRYMDIEGRFHTETFDGFWARAVMHEMDHLDGILISKYLEEEIARQPSRTSFGMKVTPQKKRVLKSRRDKSKRARKQKRHAKSIGR